jgi:protein-tyrosine phosphatase
MKTSDYTRVDLTVDPRENMLSGYTAPHLGYQFFQVPYMSEIAPNLWQGGVAEGLVLPTIIKHLLSLHVVESYQVNHRLRTSHVVTMYDDPHNPGQATRQVDRWARWVSARRKTGPVLVHCQAGLNRSSLVVARSLMLDGMDADAAIRLIREKRSPVALCNTAFEDYLRSL